MEHSTYGIPSSTAVMALELTDGQWIYEVVVIHPK